MKKIGLIGGMSWLSTETYYRVINDTINHQFGQHYSAEILLNSLNFQYIDKWMHNGQWDLVEEALKNAVDAVSRAGADFFLFCCNSVHKVYDCENEAVAIDGYHIMSPIVQIIKNNNYKKIGILGTNFTMTENFHHDFICQQLAVDILVPSEYERKAIHHIIFDQLCDSSTCQQNEGLQRLVDAFVARTKPDALVLACTELMHGINLDIVPVPVLVTTVLHAKSAALMSIGSIDANIFSSAEAQEAI